MWTADSTQTTNTKLAKWVRTCSGYHLLNQNIIYTAHWTNSIWKCYFSFFRNVLVTMSFSRCKQANKKSEKTKTKVTTSRLFLKVKRLLFFFLLGSPSFSNGSRKKIEWHGGAAREVERLCCSANEVANDFEQRIPLCLAFLLFFSVSFPFQIYKRIYTPRSLHISHGKIMQTYYEIRGSSSEKVWGNVGPKMESETSTTEHPSVWCQLPSPGAINNSLGLCPVDKPNAIDTE